jgi:hypothetical protein
MKDLFKGLTLSGDLKAESKKVEHALFFVNGERCYLVHEVGSVLEADLEGCGGRDSEAGPWTELPKEDGLWIWEGIPGWSSGVNWEGIDEGGDPIYEGRGKARRPNSEELSIITFGPIEKLWGKSQLFENAQLCSTCGLRMDDPNHDGEGGPPA